MFLVVAMALQVVAVPPDKTDIPIAYHGHWALDVRYCTEPGPASVWINARHIDFYERHGFLDLVQLNEATDPPTFHGTFRWAKLLAFSTSTVRLELGGGELFVTEADEPNAPRNPATWRRCPA